MARKKKRKSLDIWQSKKGIIVIVNLVKRYIIESTKEYIEKGKKELKIKCDKCGNIIDIKSYAAITFYIKQGEITCSKCGNTIYFIEEETND